MPLKFVGIALLAAAAGLAQDAGDVVYRATFQGDTAGWTTLGQHASVAPSTQGAGVVFTYDLGPKIFSGVASPAPAGFAKMQRIRLHVKADHDTGMVFLLSEKKPGGGNYSAWFWSPANTWQWVEFTPADFNVNDGPNDPKDSDGKLDLNDVEGFGLFDLGQFFAQSPSNPELPIVVRVDEGKHTAMVDGLEVLSSPPAAPKVPNGAIPLSMMDRHFLDWITLGGMQIKLDDGANPLNGPALEASYQETEGRLQLLVRRVTASQVAHAKRLVFDIASEHEVTLMISLETSKPEGGAGPRFTLPIYPPGGKEVFHVNLDLADFQGDGKFDPAKWRTIALVDVTAAGGDAGGGTNRIWIGNVAAVQ